MGKQLQSWPIPKASGVYEPSCFGAVFGCHHHPMLSIEGTIPLDNSDTTLVLLNDSKFSASLRKKTSKKQRKGLKSCYLHVGLVQVGVKPLARQGFDGSIILCLRDARFLKFQSSLLALVESSLNNGPIYFNCYANLMVPLSDPNISHALEVNMMSRARDEAMSGVEPLAFSYRIYYKILSRPYGDRALKESPLGETKLFQTNVRSNSVFSRIINWDEVEIPETWVTELSKPAATERGPDNSRYRLTTDQAGRLTFVMN